MDGWTLATAAGVGGAILFAIAFLWWDNRQMRRRAEREAREVRPFPDLEEWKKGDA